MTTTPHQPEVEAVHWLGERDNTLHGNGYGSKGMTLGSGDEDEVTCKLCQSLLAARAADEDQPGLTRREVVELEEITGRIPRPTTYDAQAGRTAASHIEQGGVYAGQRLRRGHTIVDVVGEPLTVGEYFEPTATEPDRTRLLVVGEFIEKGKLLEVRADGKVYAATITTAEVDELAADIADTAATAAVVDQVDRVMTQAAGPTPDLDFAEAIAGMANSHLQEAGLALEVVMACTGCGCSDNRACTPPCAWVQGDPPRCSSCGPTQAKQ